MNSVKVTAATKPTINFFAFIVLRQSLQAMGRLAPIVTTIVVANLINVVLNWVLIFGRLGFGFLTLGDYNLIGASIVAWLGIAIVSVIAVLGPNPERRA